MKPNAGKLMASHGNATPTKPHDAWPDDMDVAMLVDRIEHIWVGLRSFITGDGPVVGFDTDHRISFGWQRRADTGS